MNRDEIPRLLDGRIPPGNEQYLLGGWDALESIIAEQKKEIAELQLRVETERGMKQAMINNNIDKTMAVDHFEEELKRANDAIARMSTQLGKQSEEITARKKENAELVLENARLRDELSQDHLQPEDQDDDEQEIPHILCIDCSGWNAPNIVDLSRDLIANFDKMRKPKRLPIWKVYRPDGALVFQFAEDRQEWDDLINETRVTQDHVRFCIEKLGYKVRCE